MAEEYRDAMAITWKKGKNGLDYFDEFKPRLGRNRFQPPERCQWHIASKPNDCPDLVARVFKLKLDALLKDRFENKIFGEIGGYAWTLEYQERGLPHVHILLIMSDPNDKPRTTEYVDKVVCC